MAMNRADGLCEKRGLAKTRDWHPIYLFKSVPVPVVFSAQEQATSTVTVPAFPAVEGA